MLFHSVCLSDEKEEFWDEELMMESDLVGSGGDGGDSV